jgi:sodium-dependent dicarboxylate transporter 2/3/5
MKIPWDVILIFGGGFALAKGFTVSGLSEVIGNILTGITDIHPLILTLAVCLLLTFLTELTSNTATTNTVLPILAAAAIAGGINPLYLMLPATISASFAFMLPVATPPNAIVYGSGKIKVEQMMKAGLNQMIKLIQLLNQ